MRSVAQIDPQAGRPPAPAGRRPARAGRQRRRYRWISLLGGLLIVVMTYFPLVFVVSNSLKSGQSIFSSGVFSLFTQFDYQNYSTAWAGVSRPLANTIIVAAGSIALGVTAAAARRGEIRPGAVTSLLAQTGPALVIHQQLHYGSPPSQAEITEIVNRVLLPALGAAAPG